MLKKITLALAGLAVSVPVLADGGWKHERRDGDRHRQYRQYQGYPPQLVIIAPPPPVYYVPEPAYHYAPPPRVYYAPPPPVYYSPQPQPSGISIRLHFPL